MAYASDIVVLGGGVAGLWLANRLTRTGLSVIVIEKEALGCGQTLASQGMIHGGQKYTLNHLLSGPAAKISAMPQRWDDAFAGTGDIDLTATRHLSYTQFMWASGSLVAGATVFAAAHAVNAGTKKLAADAFPQALRSIPKFKGPVYELPEKVVDTKSLLQALIKPLGGRLFKGEATRLAPDASLTVAGKPVRAQAVISAAGIGNETTLKLLGEKGTLTQRRPVHQIMVKTLPEALYGHVLAAGSERPRATVTSHPAAGGGYVWYLGGAVAEKSVGHDAAWAITFACEEMQKLFPHIDWKTKDWATCAVDRGESENGGKLPNGPHVHTCGKVLIAWPAKLTFAPALSDRVEAWLKDSGISPLPGLALPDLPPAEIGAYPWETAQWRTAA